MYIYIYVYICACVVLASAASRTPHMLRFDPPPNKIGDSAYPNATHVEANIVQKYKYNVKQSMKIQKLANSQTKINNSDWEAKLPT